jgi:dephospho-CoA kinase
MIIGLSGYAQVGKDTVANYLVNNYGFVKVSFADPIREALYRLNPKVDIADMRGVSLASAVDGLGWEDVKVDSEDTRKLLQRMGTEVGRDMFGEDFWVNQGLLKASQHENVVFADTRYRNEANAIKKHGGKVWRISKQNHGPVNNHPSEVALDEYKFDHSISNDLRVDDLYRGIKALIEA